MHVLPGGSGLFIDVGFRQHGQYLVGLAFFHEGFIQQLRGENIFVLPNQRIGKAAAPPA